MLDSELDYVLLNGADKDRVEMRIILEQLYS